MLCAGVPRRMEGSQRGLFIDTACGPSTSAKHFVNFGPVTSLRSCGSPLCTFIKYIYLYLLICRGEEWVHIGKNNALRWF